MFRKFTKVLLSNTNDKQDNFGFILRNYFAFLIVKDKFQQNFHLRYYKIIEINKGGWNMKIDFHCHTKSIKQGETEKRNIDSKSFVEHINDANVKIVAITNHNV